MHGPDRADRRFAGADANGDGKLRKCIKEIERFFSAKDRELDPDDMQHHETEIVPELRRESWGRTVTRYWRQAWARPS